MEGGLGVFEQPKGEQLSAGSSASRLVPAEARKAGLARPLVVLIILFIYCGQLCPKCFVCINSFSLNSDSVSPVFSPFY